MCLINDFLNVEVIKVLVKEILEDIYSKFYEQKFGAADSCYLVNISNLNVCQIVVTIVIHGCNKSVDYNLETSRQFKSTC